MLRFVISCLLVSSHINSYKSNNSNIFRKEDVIFASDFNITKLLVHADNYKHTETSESPSIFFAISDPKLEGGSCIYILEGYAAYEILEGGRDATADIYGEDVYFGAKDGLYKYYPDSFSAQRYGPFRDDIIQLQRAHGTDAIYILNSEHNIFKIERNATVKTRIQTILCATEFVLDTSNNVYYLSCDDNLPHIVKSDGSLLSITPSIIEDFIEVKLVRPAFIMDDSILFFGDGHLYVLHSNGTSEKKDFHLDMSPSALSVDAALYLVAALDRKIYEFNVMEVLLKSMIGLSTDWSKDVTRIVMSVIDASKDLWAH